MLPPKLQRNGSGGVPVWAYKGNVVASGVFKDKIKLNFFKGASLSDPKHLFNAGLEAKATRAIDIALDAENVTEVISNLVIRNQALSPRGVVYRKQP